jgi:hypothetical protein
MALIVDLRNPIPRQLIYEISLANREPKTRKVSEAKHVVGYAVQRRAVKRG